MGRRHTIEPLSSSQALIYDTEASTVASSPSKRLIFPPPLFRATPSPFLPTLFSVAIVHVDCTDVKRELGTDTKKTGSEPTCVCE